MSYRIQLDPKRRKASRFIEKVRVALVSAFEEEHLENGLTQEALAEKLGVHKSIVSRRLRGKANLTLRSIGELAWALDRDVEFRLRKNEPTRGTNQFERQMRNSGPEQHKTYRFQEKVNMTQDKEQKFGTAAL